MVLRRVALRADVWLRGALTPAEVTSAAARLRDLGAAAGRPAPRINLGVHCVLGEDPEDRADREKMIRTLGEFFEMTPEQVAAVTITGTPEQAAARILDFAAADQISLGFDGRNYLRQLDLLAEVRALLS